MVSRLISTLRICGLLATLATSLACNTLTSGSARAQSIKAAPFGDSVAPDFTLMALSGETVASSQLRGHPVLINFWVTWCGPCREEMPAIQSIFDAHKDEGLFVLAINDAEDAEDVSSFAQHYKLTMPVLLDSRGEVSQLYGITAYPTSFFIDTQGIVQQVHIGSMTESEIEGIFNADLGLYQTPAEQSITNIQPALVSQDSTTLIGCVTPTSLNIRAGPGTDFQAVQWAKQGDCFTFDARTTDSIWLRLSSDHARDGQWLWVSSKHITLDGDIGQLPPYK